jgi:class 3 adenylate cyclase
VSQGLPSGTVTFLLTDIEGSTMAWERDATATAIAVTRHYELLDEVLAGKAVATRCSCNAVCATLSARMARSA